MSTPHNSAEKGQFAKTVLMPGDPLRAKFIAETFLENPVLVNNVRGVQGYTGTWKGKPVSVMASGMGMPSIGIYSYELFTEYDVENIIRIGSAGAYQPELKLFDVILADAAYSDSSFAREQCGNTSDTIKPSAELNKKIRKAAANLGMKITEGLIHSSDVFYREKNVTYLPKVMNELHCLAVEMESFALFSNANVLGKNASCLLTVSDSFVSPEITTAEQRQTAFTDMMKIALDAAIAD